MALTEITSDPTRLNGQPCIRNLRITVRRLLDIVATYPDRQAIRRDFPDIEDEDITQALQYASSVPDDAVVALPQHS